jgi:hypothetical protein
MHWRAGIVEWPDGVGGDRRRGRVFGINSWFAGPIDHARR